MNPFGIEGPHRRRRRRRTREEEFLLLALLCILTGFALAMVVAVVS